MNQYNYGIPQKPKARVNFIKISRTLALISAALTIFFSTFGFGILRGGGRYAYYGRYGANYGDLFFLSTIIPLIIGLLILRVALQKPPDPFRWGAFFLTFGVLSLFLVRVSSGLSGFTGILLIVAGIFALIGAANQTSGSASSSISNTAPYYQQPLPPYYPPANPYISEAWSPAQPGQAPAYSGFTSTGSWPPPPGAAPTPPAPSSERFNAPPSAGATTPNPFYVTAFNQAVIQAQTGHIGQAHASFKALETDNPFDLNLLLWLASTAPSLEEADTYIKRAALQEPGSPSVAQARFWFSQQR
jgi:hypothetical protein